MSNEPKLTDDQVFFMSLVKTLNCSKFIENHEFFLELIHQLDEESLDKLQGLLYAEAFDRDLLRSSAHE